MVNNDIIIKCKDCGKLFSIPNKIEPIDLLNHQGMTIDFANHIFELRESLLLRMNKTNSEELYIRYLKEYDKVEKLIIKYSKGNSLEAYNYYGFVNTPSTCFECRMKRRENNTLKRNLLEKI